MHPEFTKNLSELALVTVAPVDVAHTYGCAPYVDNIHVACEGGGQGERMVGRG